MAFSTSDTIQLGGVIVTLFAVLVALFKEKLWQWWNKPELGVRLNCKPPDCHICRTTLNDNLNRVQHDVGNWFYLRLWVSNKGKSAAENVQVLASRLLRATAPNNYIPQNDFLPLNLVWAHSNEIFRARIPGGMGRHCDLGHIADPKFKSMHRETKPGVPEEKTILCFALEAHPLTLVHLEPPGDYKLELIVAADNAEPIKKTVRIELTGDWFETEKEMFSRGVKLSLEP